MYNILSYFLISVAILLGIASYVLAMMFPSLIFVSLGLLAIGMLSICAMTRKIR